MTKEDFINEVNEQLDIDDVEIKIDTNLQDIEDFDSFAILSLVALIHKKFKVQLKANKLQKIKTISELILLIGEDKFE